MIGILPTALIVTAEADSNEMTFSYAYDAQRYPALPKEATQSFLLFYLKEAYDWE
jgi:hypothetical protein